MRRDFENELVPRLQSPISLTTPSREIPESGVEVPKVFFLLRACMRVHVCVVLLPSFLLRALLPVKGVCEQGTRGQNRAVILVGLGEGLVYW